MQYDINALIKDYKAFIKSGTTMRKHLAALLKGGKQYLPCDVVNKLARAHEQCYENCFAVMRDTGQWVFFTTGDSKKQTRENYHEAARKQWDRTIAPLHDYERKASAVRFKKSAVDRYVEAIMKLPVAQRRAIARAIA
jgi:hypothetical protein